MEGQIQIIKRKLADFLKKYYTSMLIKGLILFLALGGCYFLITLAIEYFLWLPPVIRTVLFWVFVGVEAYLFFRFLITPLLQLLKLKTGLTEDQVAVLIGKHFNEVDDKLLNLLQLSQHPEKSELLLAGIEKRSAELSHIPFQNAVTFNSNLKYIKYLSIPLAIVLIVWLSGKALSFQDSYKRMVDHNTVYTPPAPFKFIILNDSLKALSGMPFVLKIGTEGKLQPESVQIERDGVRSYMQPDRSGNFEYILDPEDKTVSFYLTANNVSSGPYEIEVLKVPSLLNFSMSLDYPNYTGRKDQILQNTGNATIPEGTNITWNVKTSNSSTVELLVKDSSFQFQGADQEFKLYRSVFKSLSYQITTSNALLKRFEKMGFNLKVIKDQYPKITTAADKSSATTQSDQQITGEISDDYGFRKLELIYYEEENPQEKKTLLLSKPAGTIDRFRYTFPGSLVLQEGRNYLYYFQVTDNDGLRNGKTTKSAVYAHYELTAGERKEEQLQQQKEQIDDLGKSLEKVNEQASELKEIKDLNRQKSQLDYNDQRKLQNYLERQKQQEELMKEFTRNMQENLENFDQENKQEDAANDLLQERMERQQKEIEKNQQLLEELKEYSEKLDKETLTQKLEELAKKQQSNKRSLEQLLELTKRYYVQAKADNLRMELEKQAEQQDSLSESSNTDEKKKQEELNKAFEDTREKLQDLEEENNQLQKPMELGRDKKTEDNVNKEQQEALEKLQEQPQENNPSGENKHQKKAAQNIRKISQSMMSSMSMQNAQMINEDAAMLRQILENLLKFTFDQEEIMEDLNQFDQNNPNLPSYLRKQNDLKVLFEHVDDSLFALSLRRPELSETVNTNITEVYYNIDKSLERFADNQYYQGITHQQYSLTAANNLSDVLSNMLDALQNMMMGGQGSGDSFQLPDIIQSQEQLNQQMQQKMSEQNKQGEKGEQQEGEQQQGENPGKEGEQGKGQESMSEALFDIYKQQELLRQALEQKLKQLADEDQLDNKEGGLPVQKKTEELIRQMERIEQDLLNNGFNEQTLRKMQNLKHQLLKLEDAEQEQGEKEERESQTNRKEYTQNTSNQSSEAQDSFQELEILQRQVLPLREIYKQKVQRYFKGND